MIFRSGFFLLTATETGRAQLLSLIPGQDLPKMPDSAAVTLCCDLCHLQHQAVKSVFLPQDASLNVIIR